MFTSVITKENVFDFVLDEQSVLLFRDGEILNRLNFLKSVMLDPWFDAHAFEQFELLRSVALKKGLFDEVTMTSQKIELPNLGNIEPNWQRDPDY
jgi:hypothetical protein